MDLFGIPWILSSEMSLFNGLHATPGPFLIHAAPSPQSGAQFRPSFDPKADRAEALGQAETAGRARIMAIDIVGTGLGIGTNLTPSSLFGNKLSTQRQFYKIQAPAVAAPDSIAALWTPDLGRALVRGQDWRFDRSAIALMAIGWRSNGLAVSPACGGPCCSRLSCCAPGSGGNPGSRPGPDAGAGGGARAHAGGGPGANAGGRARARAGGGSGARAGGGSGAAPARADAGSRACARARRLGMGAGGKKRKG